MQIDLLRKSIAKRFQGKAARREAKRAMKKGSDTAISRTLANAVQDVTALGAKKLLIFGDNHFFKAISEALPGCTLIWLSANFTDISAGAFHPEKADYPSSDAIVVGGSQVGLGYRQILRHLSLMNLDRPVLWVGENFEFCKGVLPAPSDAEEVEALLHNHFEAFFGLKDPLQFLIEICHGPEIKRFRCILRPHQSLLIRLSEHFPKRQYPAAIVVSVEHPTLTQKRHYRLRTCADVFWKGSFTTLHSSHEFNRPSDMPVEFRLGLERVRQGEMILTVPNFDHNLDADAGLETSDGGVPASRIRNANCYIEEARIPRTATSPGPYFDCAYKGYGGSFWFAAETRSAEAEQELKGCLSGNHHIAVPRQDRIHHRKLADPSRYDLLKQQGYIFDPFPLPIMPEGSVVRFGFDCDAANPPAADFLFYFFDADGHLLGDMPYHKAKPGTIFADEMLALWPQPEAAKAHLVIVVPDWARIGYEHKGFKLLSDLVVEHTGTRDRDVTEFQSCWRNLGSLVPDFPHWLTPALSVVGRTNVLARARVGQGYRSGVLLINGSGRVDYATQATAKIIVRNLEGAALETSVVLSPFSWQLVWLDTLMPDVERHLGPGGVGALIVQSGDADLLAQLVTINQHGAVALQHLWGY